MAELLEETRANTEYIKSKGCRVVEMWECEWLEMKKTNRELQRFIATEVRRLLDQVKVMSTEKILSEVRNERLFGCVEVDIRVPDHLKNKFSEMSPIFKNTEISRDDIGEFMKAYAEELNIREFKITTTATATGTSLNKRSNKKNNGCARAL